MPRGGSYGNIAEYAYRGARAGGFGTGAARGVAAGISAVAERRKERQEKLKFMKGISAVQDELKQALGIKGDFDFEDLGYEGTMGMLNALGTSSKIGLSQAQAAAERAEVEAGPFVPEVVEAEGQLFGTTSRKSAVPLKTKPDRKLPFEGAVIEKGGVKMWWSDKDQEYKPYKPPAASPWATMPDLDEQATAQARKRLAEIEHDIAEHKRQIAAGDHRVGTLGGLKRRQTVINKLRREAAGLIAQHQVELPTGLAVDPDEIDDVLEIMDTESQ